MSAPTKTPTKRRLRRDDWIAVALGAIARGGLAAVAVEPLAAELGVTKGSFYSHFASRDELVEAALESWERSHGQSGLEHLADIDDPAEGLRQLLSAAVSFSQSDAPSVHVQLLGELDDPRVRAAVASVTAKRVDLLTASYRRLGFPPQRAADRARLAYATYVGLLQIAREAPERRMSKPELERFMTEVNAALVSAREP